MLSQGQYRDMLDYLQAFDRRGALGHVFAMYRAGTFGDADRDRLVRFVLGDGFRRALFV
jgi:hypothetical protein